jgi:hypothetical protein
LAINAKGREI